MKVLTSSIILACLFMTFPAIGNAGFEESLVFYFPLDEGKGDEVHDLSKNGFTGTFHGNPEWVSGKVGNALSFDGTSWVVIPAAEPLNNLSEYMTLCAWVRSEKANTSGGAEIAAIARDAWNPGALQLAIQDDVAKCEIERSDLVIGKGTTNINDGEWHHIAGTYDTDENELRVYADGKLEFKEEQLNDAGVYEQDWTIGSRGSQKPWIGDVDEAMVFDRALTEVEIQKIMAQGVTSVDASGKLASTWAKTKLGY